MPSITVCNLAPSRDLDRQAMAAIRGGTGTGIGSPEIKISVPITLSQTNNLVQNTSVLNNSYVGANLALDVRPNQWAMNAIALPSGMLPQLPGQAA